MTWKKGQSGNPSGRPPKARALTDTLERAGRAAITDIDGKRRAGNRVVSRALWELANYGKATLPPKEEGGDPVVLEVGAKGWFEVVKWLYSQIDGPPKKEVGLSQGDGAPLVVEVVYVDNE